MSLSVLVPLDRSVLNSVLVARGQRITGNIRVSNTNLGFYIRASTNYWAWLKAARQIELLLNTDLRRLGAGDIYTAHIVRRPFWLELFQKSRLLQAGNFFFEFEILADDPSGVRG
jgi:hypothetical protein